VRQSAQTGTLAEVRVLVLLDQPLVVEVIRLTLNHGVFETRAAANLAEATTILTEWQPHIAVVDMDLGGRKLLQRISADSGSDARIPVIGLTRRGDLKSKLDAFELGVDDIMSMPLSPEELLARVLAITRRTYDPRVPLRPVLRLGDLELDILNRTVRVGGHDLHLTGLQQSLLYLLAANAGRVVTRDQILDVLWGTDYVAESNIVDRHVRNLRISLQNDYRRPRFIQTVAGQGYRFIPSVEEVTAQGTG
jgi:DNA-binding response OmpR family regulator